MQPKRIEKLSWVLIYSGLLLLSLGLFVRRGGAAWGWALVGVGAAEVLAGAVLILVRSRMKP